MFLPASAVPPKHLWFHGGISGCFHVSVSISSDILWRDAGTRLFLGKKTPAPEGWPLRRFNKLIERVVSTAQAFRAGLIQPSWLHGKRRNGEKTHLVSLLGDVSLCEYISVVSMSVEPSHTNLKYIHVGKTPICDLCQQSCPSKPWCEHCFCNPFHHPYSMQNTGLKCSILCRLPQFQTKQTTKKMLVLFERENKTSGKVFLLGAVTTIPRQPVTASNQTTVALSVII